MFSCLFSSAVDGSGKRARHQLHWQHHREKQWDILGAAAVQVNLCQRAPESRGKQKYVSKYNCWVSEGLVLFIHQMNISSFLTNYEESFTEIAGKYRFCKTSVSLHLHHVFPYILPMFELSPCHRCLSEFQRLSVTLRLVKPGQSFISISTLQSLMSLTSPPLSSSHDSLQSDFIFTSWALTADFFSLQLILWEPVHLLCLAWTRSHNRWETVCVL